MIVYKEGCALEALLVNNEIDYLLTPYSYVNYDKFKEHSIFSKRINEYYKGLHKRVEFISTQLLKAYEDFLNNRSDSIDHKTIVEFFYDQGGVYSINTEDIYKYRIRLLGAQFYDKGPNTYYDSFKARINALQNCFRELMNEYGNWDGVSKHIYNPQYNIRSDFNRRHSITNSDVIYGMPLIGSGLSRNRSDLSINTASDLEYFKFNIQPAINDFFVNNGMTLIVYYYPEEAL